MPRSTTWEAIGGQKVRFYIKDPLTPMWAIALCVFMCANPTWEEIFSDRSSKTMYVDWSKSLVIFRWGYVPVGSPTSKGDFVCLSAVCVSQKLQASKARLAPGFAVQVLGRGYTHHLCNTILMSAHHNASMVIILSILLAILSTKDCLNRGLIV